ncbi:MAG: hypothetical protein CFE31_02820 [Rhizobiales bacterium PAR1]|nr:MAG: hypothetical protein CFE31_02820 [Rhizobiales bacterium PAR1]
MSNEKWQELLAIVIGAGGNAKRMERLRGILEFKIGFFLHKWPEWSSLSRSFDKQRAKELAQIATAASNLSKAIDGQTNSSGVLGKNGALASNYNEFKGKKEKTS